MTEDDLVKYKAFKRIVTVGNYEIKGEAVIKAALLFKWFEDLEEKMIEATKKSKIRKPSAKVKDANK